MSWVGFVKLLVEWFTSEYQKTLREVKIASSLGHYTNPKDKPQVQLPTKVATEEKTPKIINKEGSFMVPMQIIIVPRTKCEKLALW